MTPPSPPRPLGAGLLSAAQVALLATCALLASPAGAQELPAAGEEPGALEEPLVLAPPPEFLSDKPAAPERLLRDKREGQFPTGFPAIGWDQENGVVFGAFLQLYDNGARDDGFFAHSPYRARTLFGGTFTSEGVAELVTGVDLPYVLDSPYRLRLGARAQRNPISNYYGTGDEAMGPLRFPGSERSFSKHRDYVEALRDSPDSMRSYSRYVNWTATALRGAITLERDLLGGILRPQLGYRATWTDVEDYTGERVRADSPVFGLVQARQISTKLSEDAARGRIDGYEGGFDSMLRLGVTLDLRDFEPDPTSGCLVMATADVSTRALGSEFDYQRLSISAASYNSLLPELTRLVLATRFAYTAVFGEVPFYELSTLGRTTTDLEGLGGFDTLRGYKRNRFVGRAMALANVELRWSFLEFEHDQDHFRFGLVGFVDAGRAYDAVQLDLRDWRAGYGGGLRFTWNLSTVICVDVAFSDEDNVFYVAFGHPF